MAEVLFITPNIHGALKEEPLGTMLLATILRKRGVSVDVLQFYHFGDAEKFEAFLENATTQILEKQPKIVSFYTRCDTYHVTLKLAQQIKAQRSDIWVVFGGPQSDITALDTVREIPYVDFVCCGEGETTVYPLFSSLIEGEPDLTVPGLVYRKDGEVVCNPRPQLIEDLDTLPEIDYSLLQYTNAHFLGGVDMFPIDVGRGCPFGCTYCSTKTFWGRKYRLKSPQRIADEVRSIHERFGFTSFLFEHDMFTMRRKQVVETCKLLKQLDFPVTWRCSARLDCLDEELIDIMVDAGLQSLFIGIETGSARMQKLINKNLKLEHVDPMLSYILSKGLRVTASFIYGFPEETEEDAAQTAAMVARLEKLPGVDLQTHLCTFLPGTELSSRYMHEMTASEGYSDIVRDVALSHCKDLVEQHPVIFQHLLEYKTPLRTKLQHLSVFFQMWTHTKPVYRYIYERYPEDGALEMYYDFAADNAKILAQTAHLPTSQQLASLLKEDNFIKRFENDENYDIIQDIRRFKLAQTSEEVAKGGTVTDLYCFSPRDLERCARLQDMKRGRYIVSCTGRPNGGVKVEIFRRG